MTGPTGAVGYRLSTIFLGSFLVYAATASRRSVSGDVWTAYVAANRILDVGRPLLDATGVPRIERQPLPTRVGDDCP